MPLNSQNLKLKLDFVAVLSLCLISANVAVFGATTEATQLDPPGVVRDADENAIRQLASANTRIVVLIFAATDCPVSNRYIPEITRLDRELSTNGVAFWWVFPNPEDTLSVVRKHGKDFAISTPTLIDASQQLVRMAHASVTPEAAVFAVKDGSLTEVYRGRIDDRYIAFGQERPQAAHHELEEAIQAALAGRPVPRPVESAVGCSIIPVEQKP
jgi:AhpC/TSA family protein